MPHLHGVVAVLIQRIVFPINSFFLYLYHLITYSFPSFTLALFHTSSISCYHQIPKTQNYPNYPNPHISKYLSPHLPYQTQIIPHLIMILTISLPQRTTPVSYGALYLTQSSYCDFWGSFLSCKYFSLTLD